MAWSVRNGRRYYYRSIRSGGRVQNIYMGTGPVAEQAANKDLQRRIEQGRAKAAERAEQECFRAHEAPLVEACRQTDLLIRAALLASGYHRHHRGEWRKKRVRNADHR